MQKKKVTTFDDQKVLNVSSMDTPSIESHAAKDTKSPPIDGFAMPSEKARGKRQVAKK